MLWPILDSSLPGWDLEKAREAVSDAWEKELSKIRILSDDPDQKTVFYSALYHTMIAPSLFSDINGEFKGTKGDVMKADGYDRYTIFSLWDTYRALSSIVYYYPAATGQWTW
jgi:putative alpha-1,2-mannosidase